MSGWFKDTRLGWIKETIEIFGFINREHIEKKFGVSTPQASADIKAAMERWPELMTYSLNKKQYEAKP